MELEIFYEKWREIIKEIPTLNFKKEWNVKIIPPFGGALARFTVDYNGNCVSVCLGWYSWIICQDELCWELRPRKNDVKRYHMEETNDLMQDIENILESNGK